MGSRRKRIPETECTKPVGEAMRDFADYILRDANSLHVVIGPWTWQPSDGTGSRRWYFCVATSGKGRGSKPGGFRCDQVNTGSERHEAARTALFFALVARRPLVIHDFDDELNMARFCEVLWPGERITKLRESVEAEYAAETSKRAAAAQR